MELIHTCRFNEGIRCGCFNRSLCTACGFNPTEAERRAEQIRHEGLTETPLGLMLILRKGGSA